MELLLPYLAQFGAAGVAVAVVLFVHIDSSRRSDKNFKALIEQHDRHMTALNDQHDRHMTDLVSRLGERLDEIKDLISRNGRAGHIYCHQPGESIADK